MQNAVDDDVYELVNLADWEHLMAFYGAESSLPGSHPARRYFSECMQSVLPMLSMHLIEHVSVFCCSALESMTDMSNHPGPIPVHNPLVSGMVGVANDIMI